VFAPTDEAFGKIDPATLNAILADKAKLTSILTYHVVSGTYVTYITRQVYVPSYSSPLSVSPFSILYFCLHASYSSCPSSLPASPSLPPSILLRPCARR